MNYFQVLVWYNEDVTLDDYKTSVRDDNVFLRLLQKCISSCTVMLNERKNFHEIGVSDE